MGRRVTGQHQLQSPPLRGGRTKTASSAGKRGALANEWLGISRGGRNSKIHVLSEGKRRPLAVLVSEGQASDPAYLLLLLDEVHIRRPGPGRPRKRPPMVRVDRAYDARKYRQQLRSRKIVCVCPEREDAKKARLKKGSRGGRPPKFDAEAYKGYLISVPQELGELLFWRVRRQNPVLIKRVFLISLKT